MLNDRDLTNMADGIDSTLLDTCSVQRRTFNASDGSWGPPYVTVMTGAACDIMTADDLEPEFVATVLQQFNITRNDYRQITLTKAVLDAYPGIGPDWRVTRGADKYQVIAPNNSDETKPVQVILHAKKLPGTVTG